MNATYVACMLYALATERKLRDDEVQTLNTEVATSMVQAGERSLGGWTLQILELLHIAAGTQRS